MNLEFIIPFLRKTNLFHDLSEQELERVAEIAISRRIPRRSIIFTEGSEKECVYFIQKGLVKTFKTDENGHDQIVSFLSTGDMFPHIGFFHPHPYPATAEAIVDSRLLAIPVAQFETLMLNNLSIGIKMMTVLGDKIRELQEKIQGLTGQDVKHRVITLLLQLADQLGKFKDNICVIDLPMTHQEFANSVGTTRETVNRLLSQLNKEELLEVSRNQIIIFDLRGLKSQIGSS
ncbi:Crp/Fnr family transcriptional regulator [Paenibacillus sp. CAU 1782]